MLNYRQLHQFWHVARAGSVRRAAEQLFKAPRPGRNPRTGESIPIKARNVVTFHASAKLKAVVQGDVPPSEDFE